MTKNSSGSKSSSFGTFTDQGRLTVVVEDSFFPFVHVEDGKVTGLAIDALEAVARRSGIEIDYLPAQASRIQGIIADGKADAAFPMAISPERLAIFDFSDPVLFTGGGLFVAAPALAPIGLDDLQDKRIATPATGPLATFIRANAPNTTLILTNDYVEPLRMIVSGDADAAALNLEAGYALVEKFLPGRVTLPFSHFLKLPLALGVLKEQKWTLSVLHRINAAIKAVRSETLPNTDK